MLRVTVRLPDSLVEQAKIRVVKDRRTLQDLVTDALEAQLKTPERWGGAVQ
jgi:predicted DNA binding CopG/RHH family protein